MDGQSGSFDIGHTGKNGVYDIALTAMAETDGEPMYKLLIYVRLAEQLHCIKSSALSFIARPWLFYRPFHLLYVTETIIKGCKFVAYSPNFPHVR
jgi:hypothetical protein